jgi:hypothetical protein
MSHKPKKLSEAIATFILSVALIFCLPWSIVVLLQNPSNYWQWVLTLLLAGPYIRGMKRDD